MKIEIMVDYKNSRRVRMLSYAIKYANGKVKIVDFAIYLKTKYVEKNVLILCEYEAQAIARLINNE